MKYSYFFQQLSSNYRSIDRQTTEETNNYRISGARWTSVVITVVLVDIVYRLLNIYVYENIYIFMTRYSLYRENKCKLTNRVALRTHRTLNVALANNSLPANFNKFAANRVRCFCRLLSLLGEIIGFYNITKVRRTVKIGCANAVAIARHRRHRFRSTRNKIVFSKFSSFLCSILVSIKLDANDFTDVR